MDLCDLTPEGYKISMAKANADRGIRTPPSDRQPFAFWTKTKIMTLAYCFFRGSATVWVGDARFQKTAICEKSVFATGIVGTH